MYCLNLLVFNKWFGVRSEGKYKVNGKLQRLVRVQHPFFTPHIKNPI
jgi:hypothetical protein